MIKCFCGARASGSFLCRTHLHDLSTFLRDLAGTVDDRGRATSGWIEALDDAATGQTRLGGNESGGKRSGKPDSETPLKFNEKASALQAQVHGMLARIVQEMIEDRGVAFRRPEFQRPDFIGPLRVGDVRGVRYMRHGADLALWLQLHVSAIASGADVEQTFGELRACVEAIQLLIDRPIRRVWFGDCATWHEDRRTSCNEGIWAREDATEAECPKCRRTYNCDHLRLMQYSDLERQQIPWARILMANKAQPEGHQIPERTLQSWRSPIKTKRGELPARLQPRAHNPEGEPLYLWSDVRKLRDEKPQKGKTGAAARKVVAA